MIARLPRYAALKGLLVGLLAVAVGACGEQAPEAASASKVVSASYWQRVAGAIGKIGELQKGGVYRVGLPRSDLRVRVGRVTIEPALALGSYAAFVRTAGDKAMVMGDLVLAEREYNRVIERLQAGGVEITAIHKHLPAERPALWWTHFHGHGNAVGLARTLRFALKATGTPFHASTKPAPTPALDTRRLDAILGQSGKADGGVYKFSIARAEPVREGALRLPPALGIATVLGFQATGRGRAAINGDFVMTAGEVDRVIRALRRARIHVVSLHNHGLREAPRLFYLHFWANDNALKLARGLRDALDQTAARQP